MEYVTQYYRLKNKDMSWSDLGAILLSGIDILDRSNGFLQLERTGPYQPDMIISGLDDLLITNSLKEKLENSGLPGLGFKPVVKKHIVFLDWTTWDLEAENPMFTPEGGDMEKYIRSQPHAPEIAERMEDVWEVLVDENGKFKDSWTYIPGNKPVDIMRTPDSGWFIITEKMKDWLTQNSADWLEFDLLDVETDG